MIVFISTFYICLNIFNYNINRLYLSELKSVLTYLIV